MPYKDPEKRKANMAKYYQAHVEYKKKGWLAENANQP